MKLLLGSILSHIKQQFPDASIQQETNQIVFPLRIDYAEFYVFLRIYEDSKLLQLMIFFPIQYLEKCQNDLALTMHFFNGQLDIPGFGMEFESRSMFYRLLIPTIQRELDEELLEKYMKASLAVLKTYGPFIYNVATGKLTFEDIKKRGRGKMAHRPIFYDTETTGIKADRDRVIEIAAYDPVNNTTLERFINPGTPIPAEATAIHHITDEMVADAPDFSVISEEFNEFCSGDVILIAHNNDAFDIHFLRNEYKRAGLTMPSWKFLDSLKWARRYRPDLPRHSLQFLREIYGIKANNAHRALDDVIVLHQVFSQMTDDLSIDLVYDLINVKRELSHMPFGKHQGVPLKDVPESYVKWLLEQGFFDKPENGELRTSFVKIGVVPG